MLTNKRIPRSFMAKLAKVLIYVMALMLSVTPLLSVSTAEAQGGTRLVAFMTGAQETPPNTSFGRGEAQVFISEFHLCYKIRVEHLSGPVTAAHIHVGPPGVAGPVVVPLNTPNAHGFSHGCAVTDAHLRANLRNNPGNYYVNIHTARYPGGEIRGQLALAK